MQNVAGQATLGLTRSSPTIGIKEEDKDKLQGILGQSPAAPSASASSSPSASTDGMGSSKTSSPAGDKGKADGAKGGDIDDQFQKIIDKARRLAKEQGGTGSSAGSEKEQAALKREFESLLEVITKPQEAMTKEEVTMLKEACFGPLTYWVTETRPIAEAERTGLLIRGNLRSEREEVFQLVVTKVQELFNGKYQVFMIEDPEAEDDGGQRAAVGRGQNVRDVGPRVMFQIIPAAQSTPPQTDNLQKAASAILSALVVVSCLQLALASNITRLPAETLAWFANPANLNSDQLPPGLENWDPTVYFESSLPILAAVLGVNLSHEAGHRIMAAVRGVTMGPSFFIPFSEVGTFGAITPFTSLLRDRKQLWDVAMAGPLTGAAVAATLLVVGLAQTTGADPNDAEMANFMVKVPTTLFQNSLLLGGFARWALGETALRAATVPVSPLLVAGWVGLLTSCLNLLPVGCLDGGRAVQAAFGRQALALTSFFTYLGLGLGLLGSDLALPFGLYVIITQRTEEKFIQDSVTTPAGARVSLTAAAVLFAVLVLCPMAPELADSLGVGPSVRF
ncbi:hypothetical protein FOA52_001128 [Chlamydomonas sp. UWO 241]|nr:hypothetical protein FOA52_001128 [Chlamydomonas sp. UWO 241]